MESIDLIHIICILLPAILIIPFYKVFSKYSLIFIASGILMCILAGEISGLILNTTDWMRYDLTVNFTPVIEEVLKGIPILLLVFFFQEDRKHVLVYALATGIGFAIMENILIFQDAAYVMDLKWAFSRGIGAGMMHCVSTLLVGYAMSFIRTRRKLFVTGTFAALTVSVTYHSIYNIIVQTDLYMYGLLLPLMTYVPLVFLMEKRGKR